MGLDVSHGAFSGGYTAFNRLRKVVAKVIGGSWPPHEDSSLDMNLWYWDDAFSKETHPGLFEFMQHSDCDGEISPEKCESVASDLEAILPQVIAEGLGAGHIARGGGYGGVLRQFIDGCRRAAAADEPLEFR